MLKLSDNPPMLPPGTDSLTSLSGRWWVAHTKSRFEKALAWDLLEREIGYYLPMMERSRVSGGRKRRVLVPLFASYVFVCGTDEDRHAAMATDRLCQTLDVSDQTAFVRELSAIEQALNNRAGLDLYPFAAKGRRCRVTSGALAGLEGVVIDRGKAARIVLEVSILGQGAVMEVSADLLEPVN